MASNAEPTMQDRLDRYTQMLRETGVIRSRSVEQAFRTIPRHRFIARFCDRTGIWIDVPVDGSLPEATLEAIYADRSLVTHHHADGHPRWPSSSSQPSLVADMLERAELQPGMRVLEIGAGTGYNAALIAVITDAPVVTVEASAEIAEQARRALAHTEGTRVQVVWADGYGGYPPGAPYQRIIATVGCAGVSPHWLDQLQRAGRILLPLAFATANPILEVVCVGNSVRGRVLRWAGFMPAFGPLCPDDAGSSGIQPATPRTVHVVGDELGADAYFDLSLYLGLRDARTTSAAAEDMDLSYGGTALVDPERGALYVGHRDVQLAGDWSLLDDVSRYRRDWECLGRPRLDEWSCELSPSSGETPIYRPTVWLLRGEPVL